MGSRLDGSIGKSIEIVKEVISMEKIDLLDDSGKRFDGPRLPDDSGKKFDFRNPTETEKNILKKVVGMTDANIEKCAVDVNGNFQLSCKNQNLEGSTHPVTNTPYVRHTIDVNGVKIEGVFPVFDCVVTYQLPEGLLKSSEANQFTYLNQCLLKDIKTNPRFRAKFTEQEINMLSAGKKLPGFTWHHNEHCGKMQLVNTAIHAQSGHTGGDSIWCSR